MLKVLLNQIYVITLCDGYLKSHTKYRKIQIIGHGTAVQSRNFIEIAVRKTMTRNAWKKIGPGPGKKLYFNRSLGGTGSSMPIPINNRIKYQPQVFMNIQKQIFLLDILFCSCIKFNNKCRHWIFLIFL
jgi:hypothetical protein